MIVFCYFFIFFDGSCPTLTQCSSLPPHVLFPLAGPLAPVLLQVGHADKGVAQQCLGVRALISNPHG
jgi:hypothetical protein